MILLRDQESEAPAGEKKKPIQDLMLVRVVLGPKPYQRSYQGGCLAQVAPRMQTKAWAHPSSEPPPGPLVLEVAQPGNPDLCMWTPVVPRTG